VTQLHDGSLHWEMGDSDRHRNTSWTELHRPHTLEDLALDSAVRRQIAGYMAADALPHHLILHGPPATGKTSLADILAQHSFSSNQHEHVIRVSASETRSVEFVRDQVIPWVRSRGGLFRILGGDWRGMVLFSEADGLTAEAQAVLKDAMEQYASTTAFVFTTNSIDKLNEALRSRCMVIEMRNPPFEERVRVLSKVLEREGIESDPFSLVEFASAHCDMRVLLRAAQDSVASHQELRLSGVGVSPSATAWPTPVDGAEVLDGMVDAFARYLSLPNGGAPALALWVMFAHSHEAFAYSPLLAAVSPVKRSGKTRLFEVLSQLTPRALFASNITPASIFRLGGAVVDEAPDNGGRVAMPPALTLLADEGDTWLKLRPEIQGILNSGHTRRGAYIVRVVRDEPRRFSTWFPKALALIDKSATQLPPTVIDRSIVIPMRRRRSNEMLEVLRFDRLSEELQTLRMQAARWSHDHFEQLCDASPNTPDGIEDRAADNWRPLLAIAEVAGGQWPEWARAACLVLSGVADETGELTVVLLSDIQDVFVSDEAQPDRLPTQDLVASLRAIQDHPWATLTPYGLSLLLKPFNIRPRALWHTTGGRKRTLRGYFLKDFQDAFERYTRTEP
jgi:hypothetical protein